MTMKEYDAMHEAKGTPKVWRVCYAITCPGMIHSELFETEQEAREFASKMDRKYVVSCGWTWDIWGWMSRRKKAQRAKAKIDRLDVLEYGIKHGRAAAADLLLLCGPDGYNGSDYDDLMALLTKDEQPV